MNRLTMFGVALLLLHSRPGAAQSAASFEASAQVASSKSGEFSGNDLGGGGRLAWRPAPLVGVEAEFTFYPGDYPDGVAFSRGRVEGLFGATLGPRLGGLRPFVRVRPGFVTFHEAPAPFACILIYPPPLACTLAAGDMVLAVDLGGGIEFFPTRRSLVRVDVGDRALRFSGPAFDRDGTVHDTAFFSHALRLSIGAGVRF
jgi:hypothetical protein